MYYYHITDIDNIRSIRRNGLRCNKFSRKIYLFRSGRLNDLARRLRFSTLALFRVDSAGIDETIEKNGMPLFRQYYIKQRVIKPEYISFVGIYSKNKEGERYHKNKILTDIYKDIFEGAG